MPELPEVQTVVDDLNKKVAGRRIVGLWFDWPKMLKDPLDQQKNRIAHAHVKAFRKAIIGRKIIRAQRRAKNILIYLSGGYLVLVHQKMTGHLLVGKWRLSRNMPIPIAPKEMKDDPYNGYIHLLLRLDDGRMLALSDLRKFAKVLLGTNEQIENLPELRRLGPEPLDPKFTFPDFAKIIRDERRKIKQVLMDPEVISGIGNIYSDEILWAARVHPFQPAHRISNPELSRMYDAMRKILKKAVRLRGTSFGDFRDTAGKRGLYGNVRQVYGREGKPCPRCSTAIVRKKIGGRSAHFCPKCQALHNSLH